MTVTTGGRRASWLGSTSSSSTTSPSTERISTSTLNLSATSLAAVGSSSSLTVAITPSSSSALITSPDLRRIFSASSPTVTDSPTRMSSRRTSAGGAAGSSTMTGATAVGAKEGDATAAGARGAGAGAAGAGAAGAAGATEAAGLMTVGGAVWNAGRGGGAGAAGRDGDRVTRGGANGPAGCREGRDGGGAPRSSGRYGTILGSGFFGPGGPGGGATGAAGLGTTGSGGGATKVGSGTISGSGSGMNGGSGAISGGPAGLGFTIVAAGLTSACTSSSVFVFFDRDAGFLATASPPAAAASPGSSTFGFGTRLGFGASGRSRPLPSFTRSAFASVLSRGLMARMPLWPISSAATIRSLLVTPSSLASSITFTLAAATVPSPSYDLTVITSTSSIALASTADSSAASGLRSSSGARASRCPTALIAAARFGPASLGFLNAWPSRPRLSPRSRHSVSGQTYAPRPAGGVPASTTTAPFCSRTRRTSKAFGRARRHPRHVRLGGVFTRASDPPVPPSP